MGFTENVKAVEHDLFEEVRELARLQYKRSAASVFLVKHHAGADTILTFTQKLKIGIASFFTSAIELQRGEKLFLVCMFISNNLAI